MTPVDQELIDDIKGDSFTACLASILDLRIDQVPKFAAHTADTSQFWKDVDSWLCGIAIYRATEQNWRMLSLTFPDPQVLHRTYFEDAGYCILSGISPRQADGNIKYHAVVGLAAGYGISIAHDPHPSRTGLQDWGHRSVRFIVPLV